MSRGWIDLNKIEGNLQKAYDVLINMPVGDDEDWQVEEAIGHIAEALARVQGDAGSFDNQEEA